VKSENEWVLERIKLYHLRRKHPNWSLRQYRRELGHDPNWVRKWLKRMETSSSITLETFQSQSRAPKTVHKRIGSEAKQLVSELRKELSEKFHRKAGAKTIAWGLQEYAKKHAVTFALPKSLTTITQILHETGWIQPRCPHSHEPVVLPSGKSILEGFGSKTRACLSFLWSWIGERHDWCMSKAARDTTLKQL
jgi:hypothetical protein